jgi:cation transport regulator ChaB
MLDLSAGSMPHAFTQLKPKTEAEAMGMVAIGYFNFMVKKYKEAKDNKEDLTAVTMQFKLALNAVKKYCTEDKYDLRKWFVEHLTGEDI